MDASHAAFRAVEGEVRENINRILSIKGKRTVDSIHRELGRLLWDYCGMARNATGPQGYLAEDSRAT